MHCVGWSRDYDQGKRYFHLSHAFKVDQSENEFATELKQIFENLDNPNISRKLKKWQKNKGVCRDQFLIPPKTL